MESKLNKVPNDSPDRCQSVTGNGQCQFQKSEGSDHCPMHGGNKKAQSDSKASLANYRIATYQQRLSELTSNPEILKSLRSEIGLLRILIEEHFNHINGDPVQLLLRATAIGDLVMKVEKCVSSCQRLETQLGGMLDKTQAIQLAQEIVSLIDNLVTDKDIVNTIADSILKIVERISTSKQE